MCAALLLAGAFAGDVAAQDYPTRPITMIVPFAAGGPTDLLARILGAEMSSTLKQQIIIDNVNGAGGTIGTARAAKAPPDGYTLLLMHVGIATAPALYRKLSYDAMTDLEPIGRVADVPMTLVARKTLPPQNLQEFLSYAKANKDKLTIATAGVGSSSHLCGLLFMRKIDMAFNVVPYKGNGPVMNDLISGQIDVTCDQTTNTTEQIRGGTIKAYGVTAKSRLSAHAGPRHARRARPVRFRGVRVVRAMGAQGNAEADPRHGRPRAAGRGREPRLQGPHGRFELGSRDRRRGDAGGAAHASQVRARAVGDRHQAGRRRAGIRRRRRRPDEDRKPCVRWFSTDPARPW